MDHPPKRQRISRIKLKERAQAQQVPRNDANAISQESQEPAQSPESKSSEPSKPDLKRKRSRRRSTNDQHHWSRRQAAGSTSTVSADITQVLSSTVLVSIGVDISGHTTSMTTVTLPPAPSSDVTVPGDSTSTPGNSVSTPPVPSAAPSSNPAISTSSSVPSLDSSSPATTAPAGSSTSGPEGFIAATPGFPSLSLVSTNGTLTVLQAASSTHGASIVSIDGMSPNATIFVMTSSHTTKTTHLSSIESSTQSSGSFSSLYSSSTDSFTTTEISTPGPGPYTTIYATSTGAGPAATDKGEIGKNPTNGNPPPTPVVVGGVVGGVAGAAIGLLVVLMLVRWYRGRQQRAGLRALSENDSSTDLQPYGSRPTTQRGHNLFMSAGAPAWMQRLGGHRDDSLEPPQPMQERGFQRVSGRKLPSAFSGGITAEQVNSRDFAQTEGPIVPTFRDSAGSDEAGDEDELGALAVILPPSRSATPARFGLQVSTDSAAALQAYHDDPAIDKETMRPSPARTATVHDVELTNSPISPAEPSSAVVDRLSQSVTPAMTQGNPPSRVVSPTTVSRSGSTSTLRRTGSIYDSARGSKFKEEV
ncbi:hypothetical protein K402DRAFT_405346 [Aulographum hederae CBS 113979]|uniref:Uncharacterized protein n=1 Tax=Aulographum hederae CBS 113979 TaxID=1176131 RepID=A0A6G1GW68_9PEZI|nr:hypothetical protein K402DRAFT_405346 [Aulographum hederae CBS 113979]